MKKPTDPIREAIYDSTGDTFQAWFVDRPEPSVNRPLDDGEGLYAIVSLGDRDRIIGYEIINFSHYASIHTEWRPLFNTLKQLPGGEVVWREPSPGAGLQQLIHA